MIQFAFLEKTTNSINSTQFIISIDKLAAQIDCLLYNNNSSYSIDQQMNSHPDNDESPTIPGYNYQSLFRKKSHIRLARKKQKEESGRRNRPEPCERESKNVLKGHWSQQENKLYHFFLEIHSRHFVQRHLRRSDKIFKSMAAFVGTREAQQCRSHHQKMQKKYLTFYQILTKLRIQFFSSVDSHPVLEQMQRRGLLCKQDLITGDQLKNGEKEKQRSEGQHRHDEELSSGASVEHADLMGEDYEKQLDMIAQFGERK